MPSCCKNNPVIVAHGNKFCRDHFIKYYERKVEKVLRTIMKENKITENPNNTKVLVAVSGGKDSMALAYLMYKFSQKYDYKVELLYIDLGIGDYSKNSKKTIEEFSQAHNIKLNIIRASDEILSIEEIKDLKEHTKISKNKNRKDKKAKNIIRTKLLVKPICSYCGLIKRYLINKFAYENNFDIVAIGHNLDDEITFAFINLLNQDIQQLLRTNVFIPSNKKLKLVARAKPLYFCTEKENLVYCLLNNIPFYNEECPFATNATQLKFKKLINKIEEEKPGFKMNFIKGILKMKKYLMENTPLNYQQHEEQEEIHNCKVCGYATTSQVCAFCRLKRVIGRDHKNYKHKKIKLKR